MWEAMNGTLRLLLTRDLPQAERTFGVLTNELTGELIGQTMEPGTVDRDFPRVPTGFYALERHDSIRYGRTVAIVGATVSHWITPGIDRSNCLIHAGNVDQDTRGCIIVAERRGDLMGEPAVLNSRPILQALLLQIEAMAYAYLTIR